jgi:GABA permease
MAQPYVSALRQLKVPGGAAIMNGVILTAVLSPLNSGLFASSRMLMALARRGDAPSGTNTQPLRGLRQMWGKRLGRRDISLPSSGHSLA